MSNRSPWSRESYELAYLAAYAALGLSVPLGEARELAEQTETVDELMAAVKAMRVGGMRAAFDTLAQIRGCDAGGKR